MLIANLTQPNLMRSLKITALAFTLCAVAASLAHAELSGPTTVSNQDIGNQDPDTVLAYFQSHFGMPDASTCFRGDADGSGNITGTYDLSGGGTISFQNTSDNGVIVNFDLTGTGQVICGFEIFGGGSANFYTVTADEGVVGTNDTFVIHTPENNGGQLPAISHIQVFCCPGGTSVPDSGMTAMLLGSALTGLGVVRRFWKS